MENILLKPLLESAEKNAAAFVAANGTSPLRPPVYNAEKYVDDVVSSKYFAALAILRHYVKLTSDAYWSGVGAFNVDLFMLTPSASSPMGPGSDSEVITVQFGDYQTNLTNSSQFGFEPLMFHLDKAYCYLPSMRGENPDARHLNQFFHCEAEMVGTLPDLMPLIEGYVKALSCTLMALAPLAEIMSVDFSKTKDVLNAVIAADSFRKETFEAAYAQMNTDSSLCSKSNFGRNITNAGEIALARSGGNGLPIWLCNYDRDIVPFYQKPNPANPDTVINADLLFAPIIDGGLGGEIVGSGQRQDNAEELYESLHRQQIDPAPYGWYTNLRRHAEYKPTSGFGLGIERFIAWALGYPEIKDVILYPRLKNIRTLP